MPFSAETSGRVSTLRPSPEIGLIWPGWWFGWCTFTTHGPDQLLRRECYWWADWHSPPLCSLGQGSPTAAPWQWSPELSHPYRRTWLKTSITKPTAAIWAKLWPRRMPDLVDCTDDWIQVQMSREVWHPYWWKELKALYRDCLANDLSDAHVLQFVWGQTMAFRLPVAQEEKSGWWEAPCSLSRLCHQDLLPQVVPLIWGTSRLLAGRSPGTGPTSAMLCREVQDASQSPVQCSMGPSKVYGTPDAAGCEWNCGGFTAGTCRWWTQSSSDIGGRSCTPGRWTWAPGGSGAYYIPPECPETPEPEETTKAVWFSKPTCPTIYSIKFL